MTAQAPRDGNQVPSLLLKDDVTGETVAALADASGNLLIAATLANATVPNGGTGVTSFTAYAPIFGGTTSTGALQSGTVGTLGQVLTSNGAGALPTFQAPAGGSGTVTSVSVTTANGVSGSVATATTTPAITLTLGDITPSKVNGNVITTGTGTLTLGAGKTLTASNSITLAGVDGKTLTQNKSMTFTAADDTGVYTFPTGTKTLVATDVTALSSLATVGTITSGVWNGTDVAVTDGGTGLSATTAYAVLCGGTTSTAALQSIASVGTSGQVLTSNGAGALPTFQTAAGGTPRRTFAQTMQIESTTSLGTVSPTNVSYGLQCSMNTNGGSSAFGTNFIDEGNYAMYDNNPEINVISIYDAGSATGSGNLYFGDCGGSTAPTVTGTGKRMCVIARTAATVLTWNAVNADGTTNSNATISSVTAGLSNNWRIVKTGSTNIKWYLNGTLKVTSTTNLPSGNSATATLFMAGVNNDAGDTTTRTGRFGFFNLLLDSPNS